MNIDFKHINRAALATLPAILDRWLPGGRRCGSEYLVRNPKWIDRRFGSFSINMTTGRWSDFATGDTGGDPISLASYLFDLSQGEAACRVARMLGISERGQ